MNEIIYFSIFNWYGSDLMEKVNEEYAAKVRSSQKYQRSEWNNKEDKMEKWNLHTILNNIRKVE